MNVDFDDVHATLGGSEVLRGITLPVRSGSVLGVVGPNGSGKTTLLRTLYRMVRPARGSVRLEGRDLWQLRPREVARCVAVMTQESTSAAELPVVDAVLLGRTPHHRGIGPDSEEDRRIVAESLREVGALDLAGRTMGELSGGQRQRVLLARALAQRCPVLVLDEPTNHLDIAFQLELMALVRGLGRTVLAALHDLNLAAAHCDDVAVLDGGRLVATGPPAEVLTPALVRDVFGVDAARLNHPHTNEPVLAFSSLARTATKESSPPCPALP
ncbi:ABC transporter ATP-binding protein [Nocardioides sp.]|uniref:ABC transporter ATP-binding protein n=1 Tax=Nocardioides sp. TaxID=35761 RepID=UPI0027325C09|nr:ABC transporter ATP-binding protein [Nocardioides sp.]MDP3893483.1 ABC transporter ATP-binding protein [Nocardioides sp.]